MACEGDIGRYLLILDEVDGCIPCFELLFRIVIFLVAEKKNWILLLFIDEVFSVAKRVGCGKVGNSK